MKYFTQDFQGMDYREQKQVKHFVSNAQLMASRIPKVSWHILWLEQWFSVSVTLFPREYQAMSGDICSCWLLGEGTDATWMLWIVSSWHTLNPPTAWKVHQCSTERSTTDGPGKNPDPGLFLSAGAMLRMVTEWLWQRWPFFRQSLLSSSLYKCGLYLDLSSISCSLV